VKHKRSHGLLFGAAVLTCAVATVLAAARTDHITVDLRGTARVAARFEGNAVVWLDAPGAPRADAPSKRVVLDQRNLSFSPGVLVVRVGTTVELMVAARDGSRSP